MLPHETFSPPIKSAPATPTSRLAADGLSALSFIVLLNLASGCALETDHGQGENTFEADAESGVNFGSREQALSADDECHLVSANKITNGSHDSFTTGTNYGTSGCSHAYVWEARDFLPMDYPYLPYIGYVDAGEAGDGENCERTRLMIYAWERHRIFNFTYWVFLGSNSYWGRQGGGCRPLGQHAVKLDALKGIYPIEDIDTWERRNLRFAISARLYDKPKDSSSRYVKRPIFVQGLGQ